VPKVETWGVFDENRWKRRVKRESETIRVTLRFRDGVALSGVVEAKVWTRVDLTAVGAR